VSVVKGSPERMFPALLFVLPWILVFLLSGFLCKDSMRYLFVCSMLLVCLAVLGGSLVPEAYLPEELRQLAQWMPNRNFTYVMGGVWQ